MPSSATQPTVPRGFSPEKARLVWNAASSRSRANRSRSRSTMSASLSMRSKPASSANASAPGPTRRRSCPSPPRRRWATRIGVGDPADVRDGAPAVRRAAHQPGVELGPAGAVEHGAVARVERRVRLQHGHGFDDGVERRRAFFEAGTTACERLRQPFDVRRRLGLRDVPRAAVDEERRTAGLRRIDRRRAHRRAAHPNIPKAFSKCSISGSRPPRRTAITSKRASAPSSRVSWRYASATRMMASCLSRVTAASGRP